MDILASTSLFRSVKVVLGYVRWTRSRDRVLQVIFLASKMSQTQGLTVGLGTVLAARRVLMLALGEHKAKVVNEALEGPVSDRVPASYLQEHGDVRALLDTSAAAQLTGAATPWLLGNVEWTDSLIKVAVLWLCRQTGKALLKLDDDDYRKHDLHQLLRHHGPAQLLSHRVFRWMMDTIEYHPGGRERKRSSVSRRIRMMM